MKILFTGGGTAGHIFPIIAIARELKKNYPREDLKLYYIGPNDEFRSLLTQEGIKVKTILAGKIRRYFSWQNFIDVFFRIPLGFIQAFFYVFVIAPDLIFSKGGYGSLSVAISGRLLLTPIFLHESDVAAGLSNRIMGRFALEIFTAFPVEKIKNLPAKKLLFVGNPLRKEIIEGSKEEARKIFKLTGEKPIILLIGGSQGAQKINDMVLIILSDALKDFEIIHQTGRKLFEQAQAESRVVIGEDARKFYHPVAFLSEKELSHAYQAADLVISRAGAGSIFELAANGKASILIPLPSAAQNHQIKNAYAFAEKGAALVMEETNIKPYFFLERLKFLFSRPEELKLMATRAKEFSNVRAAEIIANYIIEYLNLNNPR